MFKRIKTVQGQLNAKMCYSPVVVETYNLLTVKDMCKFAKYK